MHQCVLSHTFIYTHTPIKASCLNLLDPIVVCVAVHLLQGPLYIRPLILTSVSPNVTTFQPPSPLTTVESTRFFSDHPLFYDVDFNALITKEPCLNSVQLPVEDEESTQEGTPSTHPP